MPRSDSTQVTFPDELVDWSPEFPDGYPPELEGYDTADEAVMMGGREFPESLWIEPSEWKDRARELDGRSLWAENFRNRFTNQHPTDECTCHSLSQGWEAAYNATRMGAGRPIFVSPISIYAEANPRIRGGATCLGVLQIAIDRGFLPDHAGPGGLDDQRQRFPHTIHGTCGKGNSQQTRGPWVPVDRFPEGWRETARQLRVTEVIVPRSWEQVVCCVLHSRVVNVGRSGHAVPYNRVVWRDGELFVAYSDSYDIIRYDSLRMVKSAVNGSSCVWNVTVPDDWNVPITGGLHV